MEKDSGILEMFWTSCSDTTLGYSPWVLILTLNWESFKLECFPCCSSEKETRLNDTEKYKERKKYLKPDQHVENINIALKGKLFVIISFNEVFVAPLTWWHLLSEV